MTGAITALGLGMAGCDASPRAPHVIIYLIDTLRADHMSVYGYARPTSPVLERFAQEAVVFDDAQAQASWTKPSIGSLFTGLYPSRHGAVRRKHALAPDAVTLAELLRDQGYTTAAFSSNPNLLPVFGFARGFDAFVDVESVARSGTAEKVLAEVASYLDSEPAGPLFLYIHTRDPHEPYAPSAEWAARFPPLGPGRRAARLAAYDAEIGYADDQLGRFIEDLRRRDLYDDAVLVVASDHGEEFREHGAWLHGHTLHRELVHVPLLIKLPKGQAASSNSKVSSKVSSKVRSAVARRVSQSVRLMDVFPTLLELLGIAEPEGLDATSFAALLTGGDVRGYAPTLYAEQDLDQNTLSSLVRDGYKLIVRERPESRRGVSLYDLASDPAELRDLAELEPERAALLTRALERTRSGHRAGTWLAFSNAAALGARRHLVGSVELVTGGVFLRVEGIELEDDDHFELDSGGRQVRFDFRLANARNPTEQRPLILRDVDRMRLLTEDPQARMKLRIDGQAQERVVLGTATPARPVALPFELASGPGDSPSDPPSDSPSEGSFSIDLPQGFAHVQIRERDAFTHIYRIAPPPRHEVAIDPELDARLRALGYTGD